MISLPVLLFSPNVSYWLLGASKVGIPGETLGASFAELSLLK